MTSGNDCGPPLIPHDPEELAKPLLVAVQQKPCHLNINRNRRSVLLGRQVHATVCFYLDCLAIVLLSQSV
jgi:hypothetical protein